MIISKYISFYITFAKFFNYSKLFQLKANIFKTKENYFLITDKYFSIKIILIFFHNKSKNIQKNNNDEFN